MVVGLLASTALAQGMYTQAPFFDDAVANGTLPPVDQRLPSQPYVYTPLSEVGVYGGQFNVFSLGNHPWNDVTEEPARGPFLQIMLQDGSIEPDVALTFELTDNFSVTTIELREGMRWSNGDPFTTEDMRFKFEDMDEFGWSALYGPDSGAAATIEVAGPTSYIINHGLSLPRVILDTVHWRGGEWTMFAPSNWLKQWHSDFNENAEALAMEEGFETAAEAFAWHANINPLNDTNKPTTHPWFPVEFSTTARLYERNPYFHQVDTAGQQLPYVDSVLSQIVDAETYNLKVISGEADLAWGSTSFDNVTLYLENQEAGNYVANLIPTFTTGDVVLFPNYTHPNPTWRELFATVEFRQALSVAINREEIADVIYQGFAVPLQFTVTEFSPLYKEEWGTSWVQYDPDLANSMLDDLGLTERDGNGIRMDADGASLVFFINISPETTGAQVATHELIREFWADVGIGFEIRTRAQGVFEGGEWDFWSDHEGNGEMYTTTLRGGLIGFRINPWEIYRRAERDIARGATTLADYDGGVIPGEPPPPELNALFDIRDDLLTTEFGGQEYTFLADTYFQGLSDGTYSIGTVGQIPLIFVARPNIGNLVQTLPPWLEGALDLNHFAHQYYYKPE